MISVLKDIKQSYSISSLITLILGLIFICYPDLSGIFLCYLLGIALLLMGAMQLYLYVRAEKKGIFSRFKMLMYIILVLLGFWICIKPETILELIPVVLGIVLIMHAIQDAGYTIEIKNTGTDRWWIALLATLVIFVLGVFLVLYPFMAIEMAMIYVGISLAYNGISDLVLVIVKGYCKRKTEKSVKDMAENIPMEK